MNSNPFLVPRIIAHRGACGHAPENTLAALSEAAALGATWVEFDVKLTGDGEAVLIHDDDLDRTTDGTGLVAERTLADLRGLDAGGWFSEAFRGQRIPTLGEAMALLGRLGLGANVEIKPSPGREEETARVVAGILERDWPASLPVPLLSSFQSLSLAAARHAVPALPRALLAKAVPADWKDLLAELGCQALHCDHRKLKRSVAQAVRAAGYPVRCYTVNDLKRAKTLFQWCVETVITDYPDRLRGVAVEP